MIDYYQKNKERERRKKKIRARIIALFVILLALFFVLGLIFRSDIFNIKNMSVSAKSTVSQEEAKNVFNEIIRERNFYNFIFGKENIIAAYLKRETIENKLKAELKFAKNLSLDFDIAKRNIVITFSEKEKFGLWCAKQEQDFYSCFWFDRNGTAFAEGPDSSGSLIRKILDNSGETIFEGKEILKKENFESLLGAFDFLERLGIRINAIIIDDSISEEARTNNPNYPIFYFSLRENPLFAISTIKELIPKFSNIQYIDLRTKNRVFYK